MIVQIWKKSLVKKCRKNMQKRFVSKNEYGHVIEDEELE